MSNDNSHLVVVHKGETYKISPFVVDLSDQIACPPGSLVMEHMIEGFEKVLYTVSDYTDDSFGFVYDEAQEGSDYGLYVSVQDQDLFDRAAELMASIQEEGDLA